MLEIVLKHFRSYNVFSIDFGLDECEESYISGPTVHDELQLACNACYLPKSTKISIMNEANSKLIAR